MNELRKLKFYILLFSIASLLVLLIGLYGYIEKKQIIDRYINISEGLIAITIDHFNQENIELNFENINQSTPLAEGLDHIFRFSKDGFSIADMILVNSRGEIIYSPSFPNQNNEYIEAEKFYQFEKQKTVAFHPELFFLNSISVPAEKKSIFTYSPIVQENQIAGYIGYQYKIPDIEMIYFIYDQMVVGVTILLLMILSVFLIKYLRSYNHVEEQNYYQQYVLSNMFTNASDGIMVLDENRRVKRINKAMEHMLGKRLEEFEDGMTCRELLNCSNPEGGSGLLPFECPLRSKKNQDNVFEFNITNSFGEIVNVSATVSTIQHELTGEKEMIFLIRDETIRKKEESQMELLEQFEKIIPYDMEKMTDFIVEKVKRVIHCDRVLIFEGATYESINLLNGTSLQNDENKTVNSSVESLIANTYLSRKIEVMGDSGSSLRKMDYAKYFICSPLIVNHHMYGVLLLIFNQAHTVLPNTNRKLLKVSTRIAALLKVYRTMITTNEQKIINEKLYKFNLLLNDPTEDKDVPVKALKKMREITKSDYIVFRSRSNLQLSGKSGTGSMKNNNFYDASGDIMDYTLKWGRSIHVPNFNKKSPEEFSNFSLIKDEDLQTIYTIPLILNNKVLGGILIGFRREFFITDEWINVVGTLGQMLSIHLENKELRKQIENSATLLERKRISREIHDGLAQNISFVNIELTRLKKMIEKQEYVRALQEISVMKEAVDESYIDLRETLDQLGDKDSYSKNIIEWMHQYLIEFEQTHHIKTEFISEIDALHLNDNQQVQLTRVVQEICNNIRKHAQASVVKVTISKLNHELQILFQDNGVGFDASTLEKKKYSGNGLLILKERISAINGKIKIDSKLNEGTSIQIHLGINQMEKS